MSAAARPARAPRPTRTTAERRAPLAVAPNRIPRASSGTFALVVGGILTLGLLGLLGLNTMLAQGSFAEHELATQQSALTVREQALQQQVAQLQSPEELARRALELGMVTSENPVFLDLRTGKILGTAKAGARPVPATPAPATVASGGGATKPATTPATTTKPATTKPATTKPATTKPATTKPATTKPGTTPTKPGTAKR